MSKTRGKDHTSLTETAALVVKEMKRIPGIKMIAPGEIRTNAKKRGGGRFVTATYTKGGFELLISGQSVQKIAVHTNANPKEIFTQLQTSKKLKLIEFNERERKPGM